MGEWKPMPQANMIYLKKQKKTHEHRKGFHYGEQKKNPSRTNRGRNREGFLGLHSKGLQVEACSRPGLMKE